MFDVIPHLIKFFLVVNIGSPNLRQEVNIAIQSNPLRPHITAAFLAFFKGMFLGNPGNYPT